MPSLGQTLNQRFEECPALGKCRINDWKNAQPWAKYKTYYKLKLLKNGTVFKT
jgi:hypothetical protein